MYKLHPKDTISVILEITFDDIVVQYNARLIRN